MPKYLIIADDFTGANDTGVQLKKRGIETQVIVNLKDICEINTSCVIDTESRGLGEKEAYESVKNYIRDILKEEFEFVYKKVDSTLRGNLVSEIKAIDDIYKPELIIFAPAFPKIGRTTVDKIHRLNETRIIETEIANDPKKPVKEDNLNKLLQGGYEEKVIHHGLLEIRSGKMDLGCSRIHSFDGERDEDLIHIVNASINTNKKILWVGSAGLADAIFTVKKPFKPSLAIVGSISEVSRSQLKYAEKNGTSILRIDVGKLLNGVNKKSYVDLGIDILAKGKDLILSSAYNREDYEKAINMGAKKFMSKEEVSIYTQEALADIGIEILKSSHVSGVFLTGGDTAISFINKCEAIGSVIIQEVITGIPLMKIKSGKFDGFKMITKAGAFGREEDIYYSLGKLKEDL
ncbi:MAG: four-carbon acid sugar kinase family protein [Clostridiaceae bacterium]